MDSSSHRSLKILIVEDDGVTARDIEATLHRRGFSVSGIATNADEARLSIESSKPDFALVDIHLNNVDSGVELATEFREKHAVSVIFVTGYSEDAVYEQASSAKPAAFIRKPFSDAELSACLEAVAERGSAVEALAAKLPGIAAIADELSEAVIVSNRDSEIAYLNSKAAEFSGWNADEALEKPQEEVLQLSEQEGLGTVISNRSGET
ncbi:MAG: response regulator, partial [Verrucomicrobiota bacterium]